MRKNISFYGNTAIAAQFMLYSKTRKCTEEDLDKFVVKLEKDILDDSNYSQDSGWISREYWYISQSYFNLGINDKFEKFKDKAYEDMVKSSKYIEDCC